MEIINEHIVYFGFDDCIEEWGFIEVSLPFIPRIGEVLGISDFLNEEQTEEHEKILSQNSHLTPEFIVKHVYHVFIQNVQHTTIYLDFYQVPAKTLPLNFSYQ